MLTGLVAGLAYSSYANACSARPSDLSARFVFPDESRAWPTNAQIYVSYTTQLPMAWTFAPEAVPNADGGAPDASPLDATAVGASIQEAPWLGLRDLQGHSVPIAIKRLPGEWRQGFLLTPTVPLSPNTIYEVTDRIVSVPCDSFRNPCRVGTSGGIGRLKTGASADLMPPQLTGTVTIKLSDEACDSSSCCGPYQVRLMTLSFPPAHDDYAGNPSVNKLQFDIPSNACGAGGCALARRANGGWACVLMLALLITWLRQRAILRDRP